MRCTFGGRIVKIGCQIAKLHLRDQYLRCKCAILAVAAKVCIQPVNYVVYTHKAEAVPLALSCGKTVAELCKL